MRWAGQACLGVACCLLLRPVFGKTNLRADLGPQLLFQRYDADKSGAYSQKELATYLHSIGKHAPVDAIKMMRKADRNRDWAIDFREFQDCVLKGCEPDAALVARLVESKKNDEDKVQKVMKKIRQGLPEGVDAMLAPAIQNTQLMLKRMDEDPELKSELKDLKNNIGSLFKPAMDLFGKAADATGLSSGSG